MKPAKFTIIELLLVVAIAGIMLAVAVPSFSRIMKGSGPGLAARELMGKINAARAYASANRVSVAIVFPNAENTELGKTGFRSGIKENYAYQSYRVCEVYSGDGGTSWQFLRWVPGENWKQVPKGVLIGTKDDASGFEAFQQAQTGTNPEDGTPGVLFVADEEAYGSDDWLPYVMTPSNAIIGRFECDLKSPFPYPTILSFNPMA